MKRSLPLLLLAALAIVAAAGCSRSAARSPAGVAPEPAPAANYKSGRGLQLSPAASAFIGLATGDAVAREVAGVRDAVAIPATALLRTAKGDFVFVANGGWFLRTPVTLGGADGPWLAVREGLYEGDVVVTHGARALWLAEIQAVNGGVGCADGH